MLKKLIVLTLVFVNIATFSQEKKIEKKIYKEAKKAKSAKLYMEYFDVYHPNGHYIEKAQKRADDIIYKDAINRNDYIQLTKYEIYFPNGSHTATLADDKDAIASYNLKNVIKSESYVKLEEYKTAHKGADIQIAEIDKRIAFLRHRDKYNAVIIANDVEEFITFLMENVESIYYKQVLVYFNDFTVKSNTREVYEKFIVFSKLKNAQKRGVNDFVENINNLWWKLIKSERNIKWFQSFIEHSTIDELKQKAQTEIYNVEYEDVIKVNTIPAYEKFIKENDKNHHLEAIQELLKMLIQRDTELFIIARAFNSRKLYKSYITENPYGKYVEKANSAIIDLPLVTNIYGKVNKDKIEVFFTIIVEKNHQVKIERIYNNYNIEMPSISQELPMVFDKTGEYMITWEVLNDIKTLEMLNSTSISGAIVFYIDVTKHSLGNVQTPIQLEKEEKEIAVLFDEIEKVPVFPGCTGENSELKKCMSSNITEYVSKNFNVDLAQDLGLTAGEKRISVQFIIDKDGIIRNINARAPHPKLKEEALRVVGLLPKMEPGKALDKPVSVRYNLPIVFNVED